MSTSSQPRDAAAQTVEDIFFDAAEDIFEDALENQELKYIVSSPLLPETHRFF